MNTSQPSGEASSDNFAAYAAFALMCLFWGSTWIALKLGVQVLPPVMFAGLRFVLAGALLALWVGVTSRTWPLQAKAMGGLFMPAMLMIAINYGLMAWGLQHVSSGLAALLNLGTMPIAMLGWAVLFGQERATRRAGLALALGVGGLIVLFGPRIATDPAEIFDAEVVAGMLAIIVGASLYALGSVLGRPRGAGLPVVPVAAWQMLAGGIALVLASLVLEPIGIEAWKGLAEPAAWGSLLYLVAAGSLAGFTVYLWLMQRWPASRVANYAFISPIFAVILGWLVFAEHIAPLEWVAAVLLLAGAYLSLSRRA